MIKLSILLDFVHSIMRLVTTASFSALLKERELILSSPPEVLDKEIPSHHVYFILAARCLSYHLRSRRTNYALL
jgi:hypothetical protein